MTLQKWIEDRAIHGFPTFSVEDVRAADLCSSEQILQNELSRLCSNKTIASVYRGYYVIIPTQYVLRGSVPATYYIDQLMSYLQKPYYVCMLSAAEMLGAAHQRPQQFYVMTTFPKRRTVSTRNVTIDWLYRDGLPEEAYEFLKQLIREYTPKANEETKAIEEYAQKIEGVSFQLQPYDRFYYSAKMKKEEFSLSEDDVKTYFNVDSVQLNGVFYAANRVYGLTFKRRYDIPTYHPDMKVFEVIDKDGETIALFYSDYFRRPTKRGGAWMSSFAKQSTFRHQIPFIYNVCNNAKAPEGQPSLLSWDEVTTLFHEFGHALHGILSHCKYNALSGTAVARDFVEMPSQFNESFASIPEIFDHYAKHVETGMAMPITLKEKMMNSINFHSAYALGENLTATCLDLAWHMLSPEEIPTAAEAPAFERKALERIGLLNNQIPPRYSTSYFNHIWGGGYAAGYYSYLWTEVLAVNIADYFAQHGALKSEIGQLFREKVLSRGNTCDLMEMFTDFTGLQAPEISGLLKARGL